jgi:hypothetical protein
MPSVPLIHGQNGDDLFRRQAHMAVKKLSNRRTLSVPPQVFELLGGTKPATGISHSRLWHWSRLAHVFVSSS